jgi:hypothetical protein
MSTVLTNTIWAKLCFTSFLFFFFSKFLLNPMALLTGYRLPPVLFQSCYLPLTELPLPVLQHITAPFPFLMSLTLQMKTAVFAEMLERPSAYNAAKCQNWICFVSSVDGVKYSFVWLLYMLLNYEACVLCPQVHCRRSCPQKWATRILWRLLAVMHLWHLSRLKRTYCVPCQETRASVIWIAQEYPDSAGCYEG